MRRSCFCDPLSISVNLCDVVIKLNAVDKLRPRFSPRVGAAGGLRERVIGKVSQSARGGRFASDIPSNLRSTLGGGLRAGETNDKTAGRRTRAGDDRVRARNIERVCARDQRAVVQPVVD